MNPKKLSRSQAQKIDLGTKTIFSYPLNLKNLSVAYMVVKGRHPKEKNKYLLETACQFVIFVTKGNGTIYAGTEKYEVKIADVIYVPANTKFAVEGDLEYVTVDNPGFYPEQSTEIESTLNS